MAGLKLVHVPPGVAELNVVVEPTQTFIVPVIGAAMGFTVIDTNVLQPVAGSEYSMTVAPVVTGVTVPVVDPMVATAVVPLLQVPPDVRSIKVTEEPIQTLPGPIITDGNALTVTILTAGHPVLKV
jgi:hypothetical protein